LDIFFGWGPILGPIITALLLFTAYNILCDSWYGLLRKEKSEPENKPVTPYGSLKEHKLILIKSGASEEHAEEVVSRFRELDNK